VRAAAAEQIAPAALAVSFAKTPDHERTKAKGRMRRKTATPLSNDLELPQGAKAKKVPASEISEATNVC